MLFNRFIMFYLCASNAFSPMLLETLGRSWLLGPCAETAYRHPLPLCSNYCTPDMGGACFARRWWSPTSLVLDLEARYALLRAVNKLLADVHEVRGTSVSEDINLMVDTVYTAGIRVSRFVLAHEVTVEFSEAFEAAIDRFATCGSHELDLALRDMQRVGGTSPAFGTTPTGKSSVLGPPAATEEKSPVLGMPVDANLVLGPPAEDESPVLGEVAGESPALAPPDSAGERPGLCWPRCDICAKRTPARCLRACNGCNRRTCVHCRSAGRDGVLFCAYCRPLPPPGPPPAIGTEGESLLLGPPPTTATTGESSVLGPR